MNEKEINLANRLLIDNTNRWQSDITKITNRRKKEGKKIYTEDQKIELYNKWKHEGCIDSYNELIESTLPFVLKYTRNLINGYGDHNIEVKDFEQQGNLALLDAMETYLPEKGTFSSHLRNNCIPKFFFPFIKKHSKTIREPESAIRRKKNNQQFANTFFLEKHREPVVGEVYNGHKFFYEPDIEVVSGNSIIYEDNGDLTIFDTIQAEVVDNNNEEWLTDIIKNPENYNMNKIQSKILNLRFELDSEEKDICKELQISKLKYKKEYKSIISILRNIYIQKELE